MHLNIQLFITFMLKSRLLGMFYGVVIGDVCGAPYEFYYNSKLPYSHKIKHKTKYNSRYMGTRYAALGQTTDDSEMSITLIQSIVKNKAYIEDDVILSYINWCNISNFLGRNTRQLFKGIKTIKGYKNRYIKKDMSNNQSNGSLMRATPLIFYRTS